MRGALLVAGLVSFLPGIAYGAHDSRGEITGRPASSDADLSSPFSITEGLYGFPGAILPGIRSFKFDIASLANPTSAAITAQVYFSNNSSVDANGTRVLAQSPLIAITGCFLTVPPGFSGEFTGTCPVSAADNARMVALGILRTTSTTQSIFWGLGSEAKDLIFSSQNSNDEVGLDITPAFVFTAPAGSSTPLQLTYPLPDFLSNITVTPATDIGGNWLSADVSSPNSPSTLTLTVTPTSLAAGLYSGSVDILTNSSDTVIEVVLTVLPAAPQFIQAGTKLSQTPLAFGGMFQGTSVSLSRDGNTALIGGPHESSGGNRGAAWAYSRFAGVWTEISQFEVDTGLQELVGQSVSIAADGSASLAGAPSYNSGVGAAFVYGGACSSATLAGTGFTGASGQGSGVAISGDGLTAIVGGQADNGNAGAFWFFTCSQGVWAQQSAKQVGNGATGKAMQGHSVALSADGNTAVIGGPADSSSAGAFWIYTRSGGTWSAQGSKRVVSGASTTAQVGISVALSADGNTALIGANGDSSSLGAAWIFTRSGATWTQGPKLVGTGTTGHLFQGGSVALSTDGNTAAIGGIGDNSNVGAAWIFQKSSGTWRQFGGKVVGSGAAGQSQQGAVALSGDGNTLLLGGPGDNSNTGATWAFTMSGPLPTLTSINPTSANLGASAFTLTVNGANFLNGATVEWNGVVLPTTFGSSSQLTAAVAAGLLAPAGSVNVVVANPDGTITASATFTIVAPLLSVTISHAGNFAKGQSNAVYTVTVKNATGAAGTVGTVTVTDTAPTGMTLASMAGQDWTCPPGGTTCTRNDSLPAGGSYPAITVKVNVTANAGTPLLNQVGVSGGGSATASASDSTTIITASPCDVNIDVQTDTLDVQQMVKESLSVLTPVHDLNGDGKVNVVDVQKVVRAALNLGCN